MMKKKVLLKTVKSKGVVSQKDFPEKEELLKPHEVVVTPIKTVPIDVGMVSTVNWLNSFLSVNTLFCCEGHDSVLHNEPYVMFMCWDINDLPKILCEIQSFYPGSAVNQYANVTVENYCGNLRYTIRFDSKKRFEEWKVIKNL